MNLVVPISLVFILRRQTTRHPSSLKLQKPQWASLGRILFLICSPGTRTPAPLDRSE